ncbi:hypothetical protein PF003_g126 [Phytophthora fragariae]|nr:hypothetical protein PF003_g126 [Phytophthora fragariae]
MAAKDVDAMLVMASAFVEQEEALQEVRREVYDKLVEEAWRIAMRTRHYLTTQCLDTPSDYAWMMLYTHGSDINFITATSLTRCDPSYYLNCCAISNQCMLPGRLFTNYCGASAAFTTFPRSTARVRPPKLRHNHQIMGLVLCFYVGSMEQTSVCMMFGAPPSTISRTLRSAKEALTLALKGYAPARISWPSPARQAELAKLCGSTRAASQAHIRLHRWEELKGALKF